MAIKAIIFDIDGVLADSREAVVRNTSELMAEFGFAVSDGAVKRMSSAHSADSVLIALAPSLGQDYELLRRMLSRLSEKTNQNIGLVKPTHLASRLALLADRYKLAAASNRKASAKLVLRKLGILEHFSAIVTSADARAKPEPDMLLLALKKLSVSAGEAVFIGDNREDGLAARGAGMKFVMLDGTDRKECERLLAMLLGN